MYYYRLLFLTRPLLYVVFSLYFYFILSTILSFVPNTNTLNLVPSSNFTPLIPATSINIASDVPNIDETQENKSGKAASTADSNLIKSNVTQTLITSTIPIADTHVLPKSKHSSSSSEYVVFAAGDICGEQKHSPGCKETGEIVLSESKKYIVLALGDLAYRSGTKKQFRTGYHPHWGKFKKKTYPIIGNHEKLDDYKGYYHYWGNAGNRSHPPGLPNEGFYSFDVGNSWHIIALNTDKYKDNQEKWLIDDLSKTPRNKCILVFGHKPRYSPGKYGPAGRGVPSIMKGIFNILVKYNVDLYLSGHDHIYARHKKQDGAGNAHVNGTAHFLVGTGGLDMQLIYDYNMANLESAFTSADGMKTTSNGPFGVLRLKLKEKGYDFDYLVTGGDFKDSGSAECND